jgi:hypothetical protein
MDLLKLLWNLLGNILEFERWLDRWAWSVRHWRFTLLFWTGMVLLLVIAGSIRHPPASWIYGGATLILFLFAGWRWDKQAGP